MAPRFGEKYVDTCPSVLTVTNIGAVTKAADGVR
jgi:hypothetical protein